LPCKVAVAYGFACRRRGIDHTTVYLRRRAHGDFAEAWDAALKAHSARVEEQRVVELEALTERSIISSPSDREELVGSASQLKRAGH